MNKNMLKISLNHDEANLTKISKIIIDDVYLWLARGYSFLPFGKGSAALM